MGCDVISAQAGCCLPAYELRCWNVFLPVAGHPARDLGGELRIGTQGTGCCVARPAGRRSKTWLVAGGDRLACANSGNKCMRPPSTQPTVLQLFLSVCPCVYLSVSPTYFTISQLLK
jgi:hypothetical protein